jgi:hypothetical protein
MVSIDHFRQELLAQMNRAAKGGLLDVLINSGECIAPSVAIHAQCMECHLAAMPCRLK